MHLPVQENWAEDASDVAIAVVDKKANVRAWQFNHWPHINVAKLYGIIWAALLAPCNTCIWSNSRVTILSRCKGRFWPEAIAELDALTICKNLSFQWLPSCWNLADRASHCHWDPRHSLKLTECN